MFVLLIYVSSEILSFFLANVLEADFKQCFDFFLFFNYFDGEAVVCLLKKGAFDIDVAFRVSQLLMP